MSSMIGSRASPFSVSAYSTRGGTSGNVWRSTISCSSSARNRSDSVRGLMPASERSSSQKRERPSARSRTRSRVHFPHTISAVLHTGHVSSTAISSLTLPTEVPCAAARGIDGCAPVRSGGSVLSPLDARRMQLGGGERRAGFGLAAVLDRGHVLHRRALASVGLHQQLEVMRARCHAHRVFKGDAAGLHVPEQRLIEGLHAVVATGGDHLDEL